ncbi:hypothetical protein [Couchioplanes caeruleus]|uniref:Uncharacterized protein n=2 Tax=Couchioplanes caeruleus TaxID=56438 RepID=A0A1K0FR54_9ACTN|nr:hypothetical protein [Couchioplanes caeruleus]OJF15309.1 hypothetical protein BG844_05015 [Couchioplanes caeruleus subsp. caeruleus]ROP29443.1 hypothetical protein EDD30_2238 [Couchioplanes caeruleus]
MTDHEGGRPDTEHDSEERQSSAPDAAVLAVAPGGEESSDDVPHRVGCRSELRGWAGAHLHGAVRPRRRAAGRGRPPGRWC